MTAGPPAAGVSERLQRHRVQVLGSRTAYWTSGEPDAKAIVLVHGFRGDHHGLAPLAAGLSGFQTFTPDLPGFGDSTPFERGVHDLAGYAAWLRAFVDVVVGPRPVLLLGHSFGSVVVAAAVSRGLVVSATVLVNPIGVAPLTGPHRRSVRWAGRYHRAAAVLPDRLGRALLANAVVVRAMSRFLLTSSDPGLRAWVHDQHRRYFNTFARPDVVVDAFWASVRHGVSDFAGTVTAPTLLICSDADQVTAVGDQDRLAEAFPDAELVMIPRVGHLIHYEAPARAAAELTAFWDRRGGAPPVTR